MKNILILVFSAVSIFAQHGVQQVMLGAVASSGGGGTPPTLISYTETTWNVGGNDLTSASISWQTGDVIVVVVGEEGPTAFGTPTATGLTFTSQKSNTTASTCAAMVATAVAASSSSGTVTVTKPGSNVFGFGVWVFRGSTGVGNSVEQHTSTRTVSLTPTGADGAIVWGVFDFGASAVTNWNATPTPTDVRQRVAFGANYTIYVSDLTDQTSAGAVGYGIAGTGAGTGPYSIVALEIKHQ